METWHIALLAAVGITVLIVVLYVFPLISLWMQALLSGAAVPAGSLIGMKLRGNPASLIVMSRIKAVKTNLDISIAELETHHIAGGDLTNVVDSMIKAQAKGIDLSFKDACRYDLAGDDIFAEASKKSEPSITAASS